MMTVNKIEYFFKDTNMNNQLNMYTIGKPWLRIYTSKGEIEFPLDADYDNNFYTKKFRELEELSTKPKLNIVYDFNE